MTGMSLAIAGRRLVHLLVILIIPLAFAPLAAADEAAGSTMLRIVGGSPVAQENPYPFFVSLMQKMKKSPKPEHWCGAVLVDDQTILTAAHCLWFNDFGNYLRIGWVSSKDAFIRVSTKPLSEKEPLYRIAGFMLPPPRKLPAGAADDIALVRLAAPLTGFPPVEPFES